MRKRSNASIFLSQMQVLLSLSFSLPFVLSSSVCLIYSLPPLRSRYFLLFERL